MRDSVSGTEQSDRGRSERERLRTELAASRNLIRFQRIGFFERLRTDVAKQMNTGGDTLSVNDDEAA